MDSFESQEAQGTRAAEELDDNDLEVALLTSSREAFTGFSNLAAIPPPPPRWQTAPWRR